MAKLDDVARMAGVSPVTVSRVLNHPEIVRRETRMRVLEAIESVGYIPDAAARSLAAGRSEIIALIVSDIRDPFFTTLARGVEDVAQESGYTLILGNTDEQAAKENQYLTQLVSRRVDGVLVAPSGDDLAMLRNRGVPFVLIDRKCPGVAADLITSDSYDGGRQMVRHLVERGYRSIGFIGGSPHVSTLEERLAGYRDAMREAGLDAQVWLGRYDAASGEEIVGKLVSEQRLPEALLAANSAVALGAIAALRRHGITIPADVALAAFGDVEAAVPIDPFLTVVAQPAYEMGRQAMRLLLSRLAGDDGPPQECVLPVTLVARRSTPGPRP